MDTTPEGMGNFLRVYAKYAKNTSERLKQISRVDAVCWYYGPKAPLYRPLERTYAVTLPGLNRAARVDRYLRANNAL